MHTFGKAKHQLGDVLINGHGRKVFHSIVCKIGMRDMHTPS